MEPSRRELLSVAAIGPVAGVLLSRKTHAATTGLDSSAAARERIRQRYFPDVTLINQDGKKFRFYEDIVKDRVVTINFFFSKCQELCPLVTHNLTRVYKELGDKVGREVFMNSFSLKPEEDTPKQLRAFVKEHGAGRAGWNFFTGKPADLELLRRSLGFTNPDPKLDQDINQHIGNVRYGNERLMLWGACPGMASPKFIAESVTWMLRND
jgi:protein SCO1/2